MSEDFNPNAQHEVQRQLGRCLIRLQQYERLLKAMLSMHRIGGPADELEARHAENIKRFATKTLGQLVEVLFETYAVREGTESPVLDESKVPADRISMSFQFQMQMNAERLAGVREAIEELVRMRNELVHHFIERFSIWTNDGCDAALGYLRACYELVDRRYAELREWAEHMEKARETAASFARTPMFLDMVVNGIAPDGTVHWELAGIVRALREAVEHNATDDWLRLDVAQAWMAQHHPDQTPERYMCKTWPQVLHESRAFRLEYRLENGRKVAWIRARDRW
jgi:hypothetical protein